MQSIIIQPTLAQWYGLVYEAEQRRVVHLDEALESYLVFLLMRFVEKPDLASSVLALDFLNSAQYTGEQRNVLLQELGDKCLLLSGLFPGRAQRKRVRISYFVGMGQAAYAELAHSKAGFPQVAQNFVVLMDLLQTIRSTFCNDHVLNLLEAHELFQDTRSQSAQKILTSATQGFVMFVAKDAANQSH